MATLLDFCTVRSESRLFLMSPFLGNCCFEGCSCPPGNSWWAGEAFQIQLPFSPGTESGRAHRKAACWTGYRKLWFHPGQCHDGKGPKTCSYIYLNFFLLQSWSPFLSLFNMMLSWKIRYKQAFCLPQNPNFRVWKSRAKIFGDLNLCLRYLKKKKVQTQRSTSFVFSDLWGHAV